MECVQFLEMMNYTQRLSKISHSRNMSIFLFCFFWVMMHLLDKQTFFFLKCSSSQEKLEEDL